MTNTPLAGNDNTIRRGLERCKSTYWIRLNELQQLNLFFVCVVIQYLCTAQVGCTLDRLRGSVGTPRPGPCAVEDTPPHTGACVRGEVLHSWGSGWHSSYRTHSPPHIYDTPGLQHNPCEKPDRDQQTLRDKDAHSAYVHMPALTSRLCWNHIRWTKLHNGHKIDADLNSYLRPWQV